MHFSHSCSEHNSKTNDPTVFKLDIANVLKISYKTVLRLKGQRSMLALGLISIRHGFELYECLLAGVVLQC